MGINFQNVDFKYSKKASYKQLDQVSLNINEKDEFVMIVGHTGSGKSTLVQHMNGLLLATSGRVEVFNINVIRSKKIKLKPVREHVGLVFQFPEYQIFESTVLEDIMFGPKNFGKSKEEAKQLAIQAAHRIGINDEILERSPFTLSGGQMRRVAIAGAMAINPDILLMDEAFSALDPLIRTEMQDELVKLQAKHQRTIVFISHDLDEAMRIGDRIAIMQNGEVVQVGTPDEILNNPANDYVRTFFRGVDISQVFSAKDIARRTPNGLIRKTPGFGPRSALKLLQDEDREYGYVIERGNKFVGAVSIDSLKAALTQQQGLDAALIDAPLAVDAQTPLSELLSHVGQAPCAVPVVDEDQQYVGIISKGMLLRALDREGVNNG